MNESNKNDTSFHTHSKIMTSSDWKKPFNGQLNHNEIYWSTNLNKINGHEKSIREEKFSQKNYQNDKQSTSRSVMLNGVGNLSRIHHHAENLAEINENKRKELSEKQNYKAKINKEPPDRANRFLFADSPSSLLYPSYSSLKNVSNNYPHTKMVKNGSNFNISYTDRKLSNSRHLKFAIDDYDFNNNDQLKEFKRNGYCDKSSITLEKINTRRKVKELDNLFHSSLNDLPSANKTFKETTRKRDSNLSNNNTPQHTPISLKKLNFSLPLYKETTTNLIENRKLPTTISKNDLKETSKALQNPKYIENESKKTASTKDKRFSLLNFSPNQPNITLATVQPAANNRSEFSPLYHHHKPSRISSNNMVQSAKTDKLSINSEQNTKRFDRLIENQKESQLSAKLDSLDSLDLNRLSADLIELRKDVDQFNDELNRVDEKIKTENFLNQEQSRLSIDNLLKNINNSPTKMVNGNNESNQERSKTEIFTPFIDYNAFNLKLNSHLVHLIKHSELDQKSNLLLNLVQEDHSGIIICLGQSTIINAKCSIGYYIGAISLNSTAQQLLTIGDLVLEINSRALSFNSSINLEKVNNLMNGYFNLNRYLQLRIVPRTVLMNQFRQSVKDFNDDTIRTVSFFCLKYQILKN